jgi:hypothetical protein
MVYMDPHSMVIYMVPSMVMKIVPSHGTDTPRKSTVRPSTAITFRFFAKVGYRLISPCDGVFISQIGDTPDILFAEPELTLQSVDTAIAS